MHAASSLSWNGCVSHSLSSRGGLAVSVPTPWLQALKYMGYNITPQQQKEMHDALDIDESGRVVFIDFVKLAQRMFAFKLEGSHLETHLMEALTHKEDLEMPPMPKKVGDVLRLSKHR